MKLKPDHYVPSLRWRQGEYQALLSLSEAAKSRTVPLITVPPIEFDFEAGKLKKNAHEHVEPFPKRYKQKWGTRPAWIDVDASLHAARMNSGEDVYTYVFAGLSKNKAMAVPVVTLAADADIKASIAAIIAADGRGIGLRARFEDVMRPGFTQSARDLLKDIGASVADTDLILDLGAPNYDPYTAFAGALTATLAALPDLGAFRNFVLIGTAIPESMSDVGKEGADLPRHDWLFFKQFIGKLPSGLRRPNYGDYTIVHPSFQALDMRMIKSAGKVVYATGANWNVQKGGAFRDDPEQMHDHCAEIVRSAHFRGKEFSYGDEYIALCATKAEKPSNQTQWKKVAINHHMTQVLSDLATLPSAP